MTAPYQEGLSDRLTAPVIYNPVKVAREEIRSAVAVEEKVVSWNATRFLSTSEEDLGQAAARESLASNVDMVIVAGSDGTVRAVAETVHDSDASLALVPSGKGNLFARKLSLTLDEVAGSIHTAFTGVDRPVAVGLIDMRHGDETPTTHAFRVMAGLGLDAKMLVNTDEKLKKKKVGWLALLRDLFSACVLSIRRGLGGYL
jgi:diacylglycerol kinase (ATP)